MWRSISMGLLVALCLALAGCQKMGVVTVVLSGFEQGGIGGVWFWRETVEGFDRHAQITFSGVTEEDSARLLAYRISAPGVGATLWNGELMPEPGDPEAARIRLPLPLVAVPVAFRASTWNAWGESGLSTESVIR